MTNLFKHKDIVDALFHEGLYTAAEVVDAPWFPDVPAEAGEPLFMLGDGDIRANAVCRLCAVGDWRAALVVATLLARRAGIPAWLDADLQRAVLCWRWPGAGPNDPHREALFQLLFPSTERVVAELGAELRGKTHERVEARLRDIHLQLVQLAAASIVDARLHMTFFRQRPPSAAIVELYELLPQHVLDSLSLSGMCLLGSRSFGGAVDVLAVFLRRRPDVDINGAAVDGNPVWYHMRHWLLPLLAAWTPSHPLPVLGVDINRSVTTLCVKKTLQMPLLWHMLHVAIECPTEHARKLAEYQILELLKLGAKPLDAAAAVRAPFNHGVRVLLRRWRGYTSRVLHPALGTSLDADALAQAGLRLRPHDVRAVLSRLQREDDAHLGQQIVEAFDKEARWCRRVDLVRALCVTQLAATATVTELVPVTLQLLFQRPAFPDPTAEFRVVNELGGLVVMFL